jgi:hypothetical protein
MERVEVLESEARQDEFLNRPFHRSWRAWRDSNIARCLYMARSFEGKPSVSPRITPHPYDRQWGNTSPIE